MSAMLDRVRKLIREAFEDADVDEVVEENHRVVGVIRSKKFAKKPIGERQDMITAGVRERAGDDLLRIGVLIAAAPGEDIYGRSGS